MNIHLRSALLSVLASVTALGETVYPVLDPRFTIAAVRHEGENLFGSTGIVNKRHGTSVAQLEPVSGALRFTWQFLASDPIEFVGAFFATRRPSLPTVRSDGTAGPNVRLPASASLDLRRLEKTAPASIEVVRLVLSASVKCNPRIELRDTATGAASFRIAFDPASGSSQTFTIPLAQFRGVINRARIAQLALLIDERPTVPAAGVIDIESIALIDLDGAGVAGIAALPDDDFARALARREFETIFRLADVKTGFCWDRTLAPDAIHVGATGWLLAALPYAVQQGWITRAQAEARALRILRWADRAALFHDRPTGALGNSLGAFYRFLGYNGRRKLDLGDINAAEVSVIDTGLFEYGAAMCESGFTTSSRAQREIRRRCQSILARTQWDNLVDPASGRLMLAWKPQLDTTGPGFFAAPAPFGGFWASTDATGATPLTIDFFTAEGQICAALAVGSPAHPAANSVWFNMLRPVKNAGGQNVAVSFPGAFFTALFAVGLLPATLGVDAGAPAVDWFANMIATFEAHRALSPAGTIELPDACELPNTEYLAQGRPELAGDAAAPFTGTLTPWSLEMAAGLGGAAGNEALAELKRVLNAQPALFHPLWGLADAWHPDLATFPRGGLTRTDGEWIQGQKFPLNAGAGLIGLLNRLTVGGVAARASQHAQIARGLAAIGFASLQPVPASPSVVTTSGYQLLVQRRNPDGSLAPAAPFIGRGVNWSPASRDTNTDKFDAKNAAVRRLEFGKWYQTDLPLIGAMNANLVRFPMDPGFDATLGPIGRKVLDECYARGIYVLMTVDNGVNDLARVENAVNFYKDHPAVLGWLLGNEWNLNNYYGVAMSVADAAQRTQAAAALIKSLDTQHPVFAGYGEIDINADGLRLSDTSHYVNDVCTSIDAWVLNIYRGASFGALFTQWKSIAAKPMLIGEFGTDAFKTTSPMNPNPAGAVDEAAQRDWNIALWNEISAQLSANDSTHVAIGATVFAFNDEWWKVPPHTSQRTGGWEAGVFPDGMANEEYFGLVDIDRRPRLAFFGFQAAFAP